MNKETFEENDRNIRVFGLETQKRLFESEVLLVNISTSIVELSKNLLLSGVKLCLFDDGEKVTSNDFQNIFFISGNDVGKNKAEVVKEKISSIKQNCTINIIKSLQEIKDKKIKYCGIDISGLNGESERYKAKKELKEEIEKYFAENKLILYYIKIFGDKAVVINNILDKKFFEEKNDNIEKQRFNKDEVIKENIELQESDNEERNEISQKINQENNTHNQNENHKNIIDIKDEDEEMKNKIENEEEKIENFEDDYVFLEMKEKISRLKEIVPRNNKEYINRLINGAFDLIKEKGEKNNEINFFENLVNYVIGGIVCHEMVNCIGKKKRPRTNIYFYDSFIGFGKFLNEFYDTKK